MLSWRYLPTGRVSGASPVWYQAGSKDIALVEFFEPTTPVVQDSSYAALAVAEQTADSFNAALDSKASCSAAVQETSADTFSAMAVSPMAVRLSVKEDFSDTASANSKVKVTANITLKEAFSDTAACSSKVTDTARTAIVEQTSDGVFLYRRRAKVRACPRPWRPLTIPEDAVWHLR